MKRMAGSNSVGKKAGGLEKSMKSKVGSSSVG